jgi:hypothetical protein
MGSVTEQGKFCGNPIGAFTPASEVVVQQFDFFTDKVNEYLRSANEFSQILADFEITPVELQDIIWDEGAGFTPFVEPAAVADLVVPGGVAGAAPTAPAPTSINTDNMNVTPPTGVPNELVVTIPAPPIVNLPTLPAAPAVSAVIVPVYVGDPLPEVPTLESLNLPIEPVIDIGALEVEKPVFVIPDGLEDRYYEDFGNQKDLVITHMNTHVYTPNVSIAESKDYLHRILDEGGTGLIPEIEQALFDRAIGREDVSNVQAVAQAEGEWGSRGFSLPGSTLLARTQEIRQTGRMERGRVNRELSIQFHQQEIEQMKFATEKALALEVDMLAAHTQIYNVAQALTDAHWGVLKDIYTSVLDMFKLELEVYRTDIEVYKIGLEAELLKLEIYKGQLEGQRLVGQINEQYVKIYTAELEGVLAGVEVFKAEVDGANAQIRAELSKVEVYKGQVDAYTAVAGVEKIKADIYDSEVGAQETLAKVYTAQVNAYAERISAYKEEVAAESTKVDAQISVVEANTRIYAEQIGGYRAAVQADSTNIEAAIAEYKGRIDGYVAKLSAEQYRVTGEARNFQLEIEFERNKAGGQLKQADQAIEQLKHISNMSLSATEIAAKVNSQLAASAMSAISVSAGMTTNNTLQGSDSRSCQTNYSGII